VHLGSLERLPAGNSELSRHVAGRMDFVIVRSTRRVVKLIAGKNAK
jgi:hypothetical protein